MPETAAHPADVTTAPDTDETLDVLADPDEQSETTDLDAAPAKKPGRKKSTEPPPNKGLHTAPDGHPFLDGAIWHVPKQGSPTECETTGCTKPLGAWRSYDPLAAFDDASTEVDDNAESDDAPADGEGDEPAPTEPVEEPQPA